MQNITYKVLTTTLAKELTRYQDKEEEKLAIEKLYDFIKAYIKANPNLLKHTPADRINREERELLELLQHINDNTIIKRSK